MFLIIEIIIFVFGIYSNISLVCKVMIRPLLWSTTNTFLCFLLLLNAVYLLLQMFLSIIKEITPEEEDSFLQALNYMYFDKGISKICSAQYIASLLFKSATLNILLGVLVVRFMLVRYAENIRTNSMACKSYQARLSTIGIIWSVYILAFLISVTINVVLFPFFPNSFVLVVHCRGLDLSYSTEERLKITQGQLLRLTMLLLMLVFTLFFHMRMNVTRIKRHRSGFTRNRQNIATFDQTLFATYLKLGLAIVSEVFFHLLITNSPAANHIKMYDLVTDFLNCLVVPGYWMFSTYLDFKGLWSPASIFKKTPVTPSTQFNLPSKEPRRPEEPDLGVIGEVERGKFSYGLQNIRSYQPSVQNLEVRKIFVRECSKQNQNIPGRFFFGFKSSSAFDCEDPGSGQAPSYDDAGKEIVTEKGYGYVKLTLLSK